MQNEYSIMNIESCRLIAYHQTSWGLCIKKDGFIFSELLLYSVNKTV
jgi:hypothetical protein